MTHSSRNRLLLAGGALALAVVALWWWWPAADGPADGPPRFANDRAVPPPEPSSLILPITVPLSELAASVEARIPEQLIEVEGEPLNEGWASDLSVVRPGPVVARGVDNQLVLEVPLTVKTRAYRTKRAERRAERGKDAPDGIGVDFDAILEVGSDLSIDSAWALSSQTALSVRWITPPALDLGPFRVPVRKPVEKLLMDKLAEVAEQVDADLAERDATRQTVEAAWTQLSEPRQLSETPPLWLLSVPEVLHLSDLAVHEDRLELVLGYRGTLQTVLGEPGPRAPATPLPDREEPTGEPGFTLALPAVLQWQALSEAATEAVVGQSWAPPGADAQTASVTLGAVELYPSGDLVAVRVAYSAIHPGWTTDGVVYFTGRPVVDDAARTVLFEDFTYVLDTWDTTVWSTNILVQSGLEQAVAERLIFPYGPALDQALARSSEALAQGQPTEGGGTTTGTVDQIELIGIAITEPALLVELRATGQLAVEASPDGAEPPSPPPPAPSASAPAPQPAAPEASSPESPG